MASGLHPFDQMLNSAELLDFNHLPPGSRIDVETKSRHYQIECMGGNAIRISGHPEYCPEPVVARLEGSFDKTEGLEWGIIGRGKKLVFMLNDNRPVTTSRIVSIHVDERGPAPQRSSSIH